VLRLTRNKNLERKKNRTAKRVEIRIRDKLCAVLNEELELKGTVSRDFCLRIFSSKTSPSPNRHVQKRFRIFRIFVELSVFVIDSPVMNTPGSQ
jgi:hypothetical protein